MDLYVWPPEFGLPSMDIESLQFMVACKFCAAPITFHYSTQPWESPSGDLPYFSRGEDEEGKITNIGQFIEFLRSSKQDIVLDNDLVPSQLCEFDAYQALLKQKLRPMQLLWLDKFNYSAITNHCYSQHLYFPYNLYWMGKKKKQVETIVNVTNKGQQQLMLDAIQALNLLSAKLSDNKYFCGDKPCSLDALIFGYLAPLMRIPLPNDRLQLHLAATPNLVRFVESILSIYMPLPDKILREQKLARPIWQRRKDEAQKLMEEGRIEREMRKTEKERQKESSVARIVFFAFGAITLAILFSAHTGLLVIERQEKPKPPANRPKAERNTKLTR